MSLDLRHRIPRFFGSLRPGPPRRDDLDWAKGCLSEREQRLLVQMSNPDLRHAVRVARRVDEAYDTVDDPEVSREVALAAALLHDVGKSEARLGTYGRVIATVSGVVGGLDMAEIWQERTGFTRKVGLYLRYGIIGAEMLELAGSDPVVIAWSIEHHLPEDAWSVPVGFGRLLVAADE
ncbi:MAG: HD domain-containing protein [Acidimicrobiales bacterium]